MRLPFLAALLALSCAADPVLLPDSGPCSSACGAGTVCQSGACVAVDGGGTDVVAVADQGVDAPVIVDRSAPMDTPVAVADAGADAGVDGGADVPPDTYGACLENGIRTCDGRNVMVQIGERDGGLVHHCGACGVTCAAGEVCDLCRCGR